MDGCTISLAVEAVYGKARAQILRDNMDSQLLQTYRYPDRQIP